jgi:hypothetical protein
MSIEMIAYDPVQGQVCWLTLREGFSNPTAAFGPGLAEYRPPPKTADSPWLPPTTSEALPIRAVAEPQEPKKRDQEARGTDTCLESPTWKTDQSSRVKTIEPTFGWLGNPPGGPKCRRTPQRVAPLGGVPFVNTRVQYFISNRLTIRTAFCAGCAGGPVDPEHLWRHQDMRRARRDFVILAAVI